MREFAFLFVKRGDCFTVVCAADDYRLAIKRIKVVCVHRLSDFKQNVIRNVNYRVNRRKTAYGKSAFHPLRTFKVLYLVNVIAEIARAKVKRLD